MRYFIYAKVPYAQRYQKIKLYNGDNGNIAFYLEPNGLQASIFSDSENDFATIPRIETAEQLIRRFAITMPSIKFELRTTKGKVISLSA